jgi:hypothetical protein
MLRLPAALTVTLTLAACGGHTPTPRMAASPTPLPSVGSLRMVKPPVAVYNDQDGYLGVWVRLNRPIERSDITSGDYGDRIVSLAALQGESVFGSATADVRFPSCYSDGLYVGAAPATGKRIEVELKLGAKRSMKATATVQHGTHDTHPARQLGCPRDPDGHICPGTISAKHLTIRLETAYAAPCDVAREVMTSVGRWANPHWCQYQLCVTRHRMNRGFRCNAYFDNGGEGPPAWQIECEKGRAKVTAFADESYKDMSGS